MYSKITFLLLYNFLVANRILSAPPKTFTEPINDDVLEASFDDCRKWSKKPVGSTISVSEFFSYFDDGSGCQQIVDSTIQYLNETQPGGTDQYKIDLSLYKELVKAFFKFKRLPLQYYTGITKEPSDNEILETSFDDCRKWLKKPSNPTISVSEFVSYAGNYRQTVNSTINYLKNTRPDAINKNEIDIVLYKELIDAICKVNGLPIKFFTKIRKEASDEEILETSFNNCKKWLEKPLEPTITVSEFLSYIDDGSGCKKIEDFTILYINKTQTGAAKQYKIDLSLYKQLIKAICKVNGLSLAYFAEIRKVPSDDEILETSFDNCRKWLKKPLESTISVSEFLSYFNDGFDCEQIVDSTMNVLNETQAGGTDQYKIDLGLYKEFLKEFCKYTGLPLAYFAGVRKEPSYVKDDIDALSDLVPVPTEDDILETSFDDCRKWLKKPSEPTISVFEFLSYAGNNDQTVNSTLRYLKDTQTGATNKKKIDLVLYKELVQAICKDNKLPLGIFAKIRKDASEVKKRKRITL
ncbi:uncharacterized protein LOC126846888 isoform X2 [Adelges cooleyi]|uniref:uncharacterized protein LOC126846888 isoform X2 n=1 Tax=Adelges cooleyi TaxID=133065 RepID=UPI0021802928|nr:uncharacterized protein LOC126846888 isoform X2 [Adelges cooleyi]